MNEIIEKEVLIDENYVKDNIYEIRGKKVMLDFDLAKIYGYKTRNLNRQVKNNIERFDDDFMFQLKEEGFKNLRCKNFTSSLDNYGGRRYLSFIST